MRAMGILILGLCCTVPSCCEDDDCYWQWYCFSSGGIWCAWYYICPGDPPPSPETFKADVDVFQRDEGADSVDVRVDLSGDVTEDDFPLSVTLRGPGMSDARRMGPKKRWWFHGFPASWLRRMEAMAVGTDIRLDEPLPGDALREDLPCDPVEFADLGALPEIPRTLRVGEELHFASPPAGDWLIVGENGGLVVIIIAPGSDSPRARILVEGETWDIPVERAGLWRVRLVLYSEDLCEPGTADAVFLGETKVRVRRR